MSNEATQEFIELMRKRYKEAVKFKKIWILDQVCEICGFSREHARKVLSGRARIRKKRPGPSKTYGPLACKHLINLWRLMGNMCSKRMKAALPLWLPHYYEADCIEEVRRQLLAMSPATIDRILHPFRRGTRKGLSSTRAGHLIKNRIPLKDLVRSSKYLGLSKRTQSRIVEIHWRENLFILLPSRISHLAGLKIELFGINAPTK